MISDQLRERWDRVLRLHSWRRPRSRLWILDRGRLELRLGGPRAEAARILLMHISAYAGTSSRA